VLNQMQEAEFVPWFTVAAFRITASLGGKDLACLALPPENHMLETLLRRPWLSVAIMLALCAPLIWETAQLSLRSGASSLLEGDPRSRFTYDLVEKSLHGTTVLVVVQTSPDVFTRESLTKLRDVSEAFAALPDVRDVKSFTHSSIPVRRGFALSMEPYLPTEWTDENLAKVKGFSLNHPLVRNLLVSPDAKHSVLLVTFADAKAHPSRAVLDEILAKFTDGQHSYQMVSLPLVENEVRERAEHDLVIFVPLILVCVFLALAVYFRSLRMILFLVINLAIHAALSAGVCALIPLDSGVYLLALFPLLAAVQLTLLIHLGSDFRDRLRAGESPGEAVRAAVRSVFRSSLFAALTTIAGFVALVAAPGAANHAFGLLGGACVALGCVLLFTIGPVLLLILHEGLRAPGESQLERGPSLFAKATAHPSSAWAVGVVVLIGLAGLPAIRPNLNLADFLPTDSPSRRLAHFFDEEFSGMYFLRIDLDSGRPNGVPDLEFLKYVQKVEAYAASLPDVTAIYSHASVIAMMNEVWSGWEPGSFKLPDAPLMLGIFQQALLGSGLPMTEALADPEWRVASLYVRTRILPSDEYLAMHDAILAEARRLAPPGVEARPAPGLREFLEADRAVVQGQIASVVASLTAIALCLLVLWRSARLSLAAVLCVCAPLGAALGLAAWLGVTLNSITVMAGAIVLGVAVDDAVHFVTRWQELVRAGKTALDAAQETLREKRGPITLTTTVLLAVFVPLSFSAFPPVRGFAMVAALAFLGSLACVLILLPRMLARR
jgi:predicted RND superfamily exporter protein